MRPRFILGVVAVLVAAWYLVVPNFGRVHYHPFATCKANVREIGHAIARYQVDHQDAPPGRLDDLVAGHYLASLPLCPVGATPSWQRTLTWLLALDEPSRPAMTYAYERVGANGFVVYCSGHHHPARIGQQDGPACGSEKPDADTLAEARPK